MSTEPNTGLTWQEANSLTTDALHNQVVDLLAVWLNCSVLAVDQAAPTGSEVEGDRYIVGTGTGLFAGMDGKLAILRGGTWQFHAPPDAGVPIVKNLDDGSDWECVGGVWAAKTGGTAVLADGDYGDITVSGTGTAMEIKRKPTSQSIASASAVTPVATDQYIEVTALAVGTTINNPTGTAQSGDGFLLLLKSASAQTLAWDTDYLGMDAALPTATIAGKQMAIPVTRAQTLGKWLVYKPSVQP